jgi:hypothetical protein
VHLLPVHDNGIALGACKVLGDKLIEQGADLGGFLKKLQRTHKNKHLRLFFQDESRIGQKGRVCRVWRKRGQRPPGLCDKRFTFAYIFAAVEPGTDNAFALVLPYADTEAMQEFLDQFAATIGEDEHVALILDQAGWHGAHALRVPVNITLVPLPPYSPELNPVEWVWEYMKERFLSCGCTTTTRRSSPPRRGPGGACAGTLDA